MGRSYSKNCTVVHGPERDTPPEIEVSLRAIVTLWHSWVLEQSFSSLELILERQFSLTPFLRDWIGERKLSRVLQCVEVCCSVLQCVAVCLSRVLPNTSTCSPNDRSQCLYCVLPVFRCTFGAHLDFGLDKRYTPCRFVGFLTFPALFLGEDGRLW